MALDPETEYAGRIAAASANYPHGSAVDETVPGADDGTPLLASLVNDIFGLQQALLEAVGAAPTGNEDTALASQYLDAIRELMDRQVSWLGWRLADGFYTEVSLDTSSEDILPRGMFFKPDGTKMYVMGLTNDSVYQYTLSTAWDLNTATYDTVSFSVTSESTAVGDLFFSTDGTKMYVLGQVPADVFQYTLSTAWDLSTASYDTVSLDVSTEATSPLGLFFKPDGTKMYVMDNTTDDVFQYTLSTAWDLSTASYDTVSFSTTTQDTSPLGFAFSVDGTKMYLSGSDNDSVYQYSLSTAWDLSTASYDTVAFDVSTEDTSPNAIFFSNDGTKMYMSGRVTFEVYQYSTAKAFKRS